MTTPSHANEAQHIVSVSCPGGHTAYFDKRHVCNEKIDVYRKDTDKSGKKLDRLRLKCNQCGRELIVSVNCEGYQ